MFSIFSLVRERQVFLGSISSCDNTFYFPCSYNPSFSLNLNISYSSAFLLSSSFLFGSKYFYAQHEYCIYFYELTDFCHTSISITWVWGIPHDRKKTIHIPISSNSSCGVRSSASKKPQVVRELGRNYKPTCYRHWCRGVPRTTAIPQ